MVHTYENECRDEEFYKKRVRERGGARERGSEGARQPGSQGAREPGSQGTRERGSEGVFDGVLDDTFIKRSSKIVKLVFPDLYRSSLSRHCHETIKVLVCFTKNADYAKVSWNTIGLKPSKHEVIHLRRFKNIQLQICKT